MSRLTCFLAIVVLPSAVLGQSTPNYYLQKRVGDSGTLITQKVPAAASKLWGTDASGSLGTITLGTGLSLSGGTISATATGGAWGDITGTLADQTDLASALAGKADVATTLAGYGITDAQGIDSDLTSIAALTTTSYGRGLLTLADQAALKSAVGVTTAIIGTPSTVLLRDTSGAGTVTSALYVVHSGTGATTATLGQSGLVFTNSDADGLVSLLPPTLVTDDDFQVELPAASGTIALVETLPDLEDLGGQPLDSDLTAIAALTTNSFGLAILETTNYADIQSRLGLEGAQLQKYAFYLYDSITDHSLLIQAPTAMAANGTLDLKEGRMANEEGGLGQFYSSTSASLRGVLSDETGTGAAVFAVSPTLTTPNLGTPSAGTLTSCTGLPLTTGVAGTLPIGNGGTGQTTAGAAINALLPSQTGNSGKYLTTDGTNPSWATVTAGLSGSTGSTDNALLRADGTGGGTVQSGADATLSDGGKFLSGVGNSNGGFYCNNTAYGLDYSTGWGVGWISNSDTVAIVNSNVGQKHLVVQPDGGIGFCAIGISSAPYPDTVLFRSGAGKLALRNNTGYIQSSVYPSVAAQVFEVYNTYTSSTDNELFAIDWQTTANTVRVGTKKGSAGGTARNMIIETDGTARIEITASGGIIFSGLPTTDPGVSGQLWNDSGTLKVSP